MRFLFDQIPPDEEPEHRSPVRGARCCKEGGSRVCSPSKPCWKMQDAVGERCCGAGVRCLALPCLQQGLALIQSPALDALGCGLCRRKGLQVDGTLSPWVTGDGAAEALPAAAPCASSRLGHGGQGTVYGAFPPAWCPGKTGWCFNNK